MKNTLEAFPVGSPDVRMAAIHEAFRHDLTRLRATGERPPGRLLTYLRVHHAAQESCLWPAVRAGRPVLAVLLERWERERLALVGLADGLAATLPAGRAGPQTEAFATALATHLRHEADLVAHAGPALTEREWDDYAWERHRLLGFTAFGAFLSWLLDGRSEPTRRAVLSRLPLPLRIMYRAVWSRRTAAATTGGRP